MPNVPTITPGPDDTEHTPEDVTETIPLITDVHADKQSGRTNDTVEISDEEAYAKLKAKRAERRRKKADSTRYCRRRHRCHRAHCHCRYPGSQCAATGS